MKKRKKKQLRRRRNAALKKMRGNLISVYESFTEEEVYIITTAWNKTRGEKLSIGMLPFINRGKMIEILSTTFPQSVQFSYAHRNLLKRLRS